jgi:hypothetical protein
MIRSMAMGQGVKRRRWPDNNASQDWLDLTSKNDDICNRTGLVIISINLQCPDIWVLVCNHYLLDVFTLPFTDLQVFAINSPIFINLNP